VPAGGILRRDAVAGEDRVDDSTVGLEEHVEVGPAPLERLDPKPLHRLGGRVPCLAEPIDTRERHDRQVQVSVGRRHRTVVFRGGGPLHPSKCVEKRLLGGAGGNAPGRMAGREGIDGGAELRGCFHVWHRRKSKTVQRGREAKYAKSRAAVCVDAHRGRVQPALPLT